MDRKQIVLRENWKFCLEETKEEKLPVSEEGYPHHVLGAAWYRGFNDSAWRDVTIPHDWSVELPFCRRYSSGTGYVAGGIGWYRAHFRLPEEYRGKSIRVVFDGVYKNSQVWCNSYYLGRRPYGYSTFSYDITHAASFSDQENVLCVKVVHTDLADSRWFTGSGITRKVTLVVEEPVHPAEYGVFFHGEQVEVDEGDPTRGKAHIVVEHRTAVARELPKMDGENRNRTGQESREAQQEPEGGLSSAAVKIRTVLEDREGTAVLTLEGQTQAGGECALSGILERARLWSPDSPYLYTMRTWYALDGGESLDYYLVDETAVGIRRVEFHPEKGLFINGIETKMKGVCVHHDGGALGAAMEPEVWHRRLAVLKEGGCNAIRCSHNPHMPELYDLCDRMGFLMMDEAFDEWENAKNKWSRGHNVYPPVHQGYFEEFPQWHEADLRAMVGRDRNHPSVILWSIGNEIDYPNDPYCHPSFAAMTGNNDADKPKAEQQYDVHKPNALRLVTIAEELEKIVRQEDPTRPVTLASAFPELSAETGLFRGLDVVGYNYKEHLYEKDHGRLPEKPLLGSENSHGYDAWLAVRDNSYISGQFLWTGIDYLGETKLWPEHGSSAGIMTCAGEKKPEFYRRKSFWRHEPVLEIATRRVADGPEGWRPMKSHWNYEPGEEILVKVYSNLPRVRLLLEESGGGSETGTESGKAPEVWGSGAGQGCDGRKRQDFGVLEGYNGDGEYCFTVRYRPGTLRAEGYGEPGKIRAAKGSGDGCGAEAKAMPVDTAVPTAVCSLSTAGQTEGLDCRVWRQQDVLTGQSWETASSEPGYLYQLEIGLQDGQGNPVGWQERVLSVEVDGAGELAGLENGNLADVTPYRESSRATFRGRLLVFLRRRGFGEIEVKISTGESGEINQKICLADYVHI